MEILLTRKVSYHVSGLDLWYFFLMDFKDKLKALRKERGETAEKVAKNLGISRSAYSNYEQGLRLPDFFMIVKLANYFEVSADYLLGLSAV